MLRTASEKCFPFSKFIGPVILLLFLAWSCSQDVSFDSEGWKQGARDPINNNIREIMVDDLLASDTLRNRSREEVVDLLGAAEIKQPREFRYVVRKQFGFEEDAVYRSFLVVEFDMRGRVDTVFFEE